ncbi:MAG: VOC family protein [Gammaproteobacteria bacterium]|nr:VOC family protein [Gammaproteobacteria bacterium]
MSVKLVSRILLPLALVLQGAGSGAFADSTDEGSVGHLLWQPSMNVFRRYAVDAEQMFEFYGGVLGLEQLQSFDVGGTTGVHRFRAGNSEVKLTGRVDGREYVPGGVRDATGLRLLTFFYPDKAPLIERFRAHGLAEPQFEALPGGEREVALVEDPDGHAVELVVAPNAPAELYDSIEIGLTVEDIEESREFYREFVGLEELPPVDDPVHDTTKYPYRHGTTTVSLRSFDAELPADTGTGGIQYVVTDAAFVDRLAKERGVPIDQPLSTLRGFDLRTIWLDDPDGITNYFAETGQSRRAAAQSSE